MTTEITSVRVFDGNGFSQPRSVYFQDGLFVAASKAAQVIEGGGRFLLPGLIDSHIHLSGLKNLEKAAWHGIAGLMDMATQDPQVVDRQRNLDGLPLIRSSYRAATEAGSTQATKMKIPMIGSPSDARAFVKDQLSFGADYIKIVLPNRPLSTGFNADTLRAAVDAAHEAGKKIIAHAVSTAAYEFVVGSGLDVVTHLPLDACIDYGAAESLAREGVVCVPTLIMMRGLSRRLKLITRGKVDFKHSQNSFRVLHDVGIRFLAGTDSNDDRKSPYQPKFGSALIEELRLMEEDGLSPREVLRSATTEPVEFWDLHELGRVEPGRLASFSLLKANPFDGLRNLRSMNNVWIGGRNVR